MGIQTFVYLAIESDRIGLLSEPLSSNQVFKVIKRFQALDTHFAVIKWFRKRKTIRVKEENYKKKGLYRTWYPIRGSSFGERKWKWTLCCLCSSLWVSMWASRAWHTLGASTWSYIKQKRKRRLMKKSAHIGTNDRTPYPRGRVLKSSLVDLIRFLF